MARLCTAYKDRHNDSQEWQGHSHKTNMQGTTSVTHYDNIKSHLTGVLCAPLQCVVCSDWSTCVDRGRGIMEYTTLHKSWTIPLQRTGSGCSEGWLPRQMSSTPCWMSSARTFSRHSASSASGSTSRTIQYVITTEPLPQDSTCRRCSGIPSRCARKSRSVTRSFTRRPSASSLYLTASSAMPLGASSLQSLNVTHKVLMGQKRWSDICSLVLVQIHYNMST